MHVLVWFVVGLMFHPFSARADLSRCPKEIVDLARGFEAPSFPAPDWEVDYTQHGFYRVATASPPVFVTNAMKNAEVTLEFAKRADARGAHLALFPELGITGYSTQDGFRDDDIIENSRKALAYLAEKSKTLNTVLVVGAPYQIEAGAMFNCAVVIYRGRVRGMVPKSYLPSNREFHEFKWFTPGDSVDVQVTDPLLGRFRLARKQLFGIGPLRFGAEICEDVWAREKPGVHLANAGAHLIVNPSASPDHVDKDTWRKHKLEQHSGDTATVYAYTAAGPTESTDAVVFGGHNMIYEVGTKLAESDRFVLDGTIQFADIDLKRVMHDRRENPTLRNVSVDNREFGDVVVLMAEPRPLNRLERIFSRTPFVPENDELLHKRSNDIIRTAAVGLAKKIRSAGKKKMYLGLSGGSDSTLALLICLEAAKILGWDNSKIVAITMPGKGTTSKTLQLATDLAKAFQVTFRSIPIQKAVEQHFEDIGHDMLNENLAFENSYARERTQVLFDAADDELGLVVGTSDMTESWLGWATYIGDQQSHYAVNIGIPKTLVLHLIEYYAKYPSVPEAVRPTLQAVVELMISPELTSNKQSSEAKIGPYVLHDFFLYHHIRWGYGAAKLFELARIAFHGYVHRDPDIGEFTPEKIKGWLKIFFGRGYSQQWKRINLPPGPKVGTVFLSPREDLRLATDNDGSWRIEAIDAIPMGAAQ